jgi:hypothetical protein
VHIPAKTSRNQDVPAYEAEILRRLWTTSDRKVTITEVPTSVPVEQRYIDIPDPAMEFKRVSDKYQSAMAPGKKTPLVPEIWPTTDDFITYFAGLIEKAADTDMYVGNIIPKINVPRELLEARFEGLTQELAEDLVKIGITGILDLSRRDLMSVCAARGITPALAKSLINQAKAKIESATLVGSASLE